MIKVIDVVTEPNYNGAGCSSGVQVAYTLTLSDGRTVEGYTCPCHKGCAGADRIDDITDYEFDSDLDLYDYLHS